MEEKKEKKKIITTRGIRIWSSNQGGTPPNRALSKDNKERKKIISKTARGSETPEPTTIVNAYLKISFRSQQRYMYTTLYRWNGKTLLNPHEAMGGLSRRWRSRQKVSARGGKSLILAGKTKNEKIRKENENLQYSDFITCFGDRTFFVVTSRTRIIDNFMNVFNGVTSPHVFSYRCVLHYFLTMPVGFNFIFRLSSSIYKWYM